MFDGPSIVGRSLAGVRQLNFDTSVVVDVEYLGALSNMELDNVDSMLSADAREWDALVSILEAHPNESLHDRGHPVWTSRDVYAHLARWIDRSTTELESMLQGHRLPPIPGTDDEINESWQREDATLSLDEARNRAREAYNRRIDVIHSISQDRWTDELEALARADGGEHYAGHRGYIVVN